MRHLTEEEIEKLLANRLQPADQKRIVRHLLAGCGLCSRKLVEGAPGLMLEKAAEDRHRKTVPSSPHGHAPATRWQDLPVITYRPNPAWSTHAGGWTRTRPSFRPRPIP